MPFLPRIPSLLRNLMRRRKVEQDLADEVSSYVDLSTQRKMLYIGLWLKPPTIRNWRWL